LRGFTAQEVKNQTAAAKIGNFSLNAALSDILRCVAFRNICYFESS